MAAAAAAAAAQSSNITAARRAQIICREKLSTNCNLLHNSSPTLACMLSLIRLLHPPSLSLLCIRLLFVATRFVVARAPQSPPPHFTSSPNYESLRLSSPLFCFLSLCFIYLFALNKPPQKTTKLMCVVACVLSTVRPLSLSLPLACLSLTPSDLCACSYETSLIVVRGFGVCGESFRSTRK